LAGDGLELALDMALFDIKLGIIWHYYREDHATGSDKNEE
jgi:hypothetical protein